MTRANTAQIKYNSHTYAQYRTSEVLFDEMLDVFVDVYSYNKIVLSFVEKGVSKELLSKEFIMLRIKYHSKMKIAKLLDTLRKYNQKCNTVIKNMLLFEEMLQKGV